MPGAETAMSGYCVNPSDRCFLFAFVLRALFAFHLDEQMFAIRYFYDEVSVVLPNDAVV